MIHIAEYKLSPSEKEDKKVDRLINKKAPQSRKYKTKRGPKYDNRKRRVTEDDKDLNINTVEGDKDLSLNYKYSVDDVLSFIALHLASDLKPLEKAIQAYAKDLRKSSIPISDQFLQFADLYYMQPAMNGISQFEDDGLSDINDRRENYNKLRQTLSRQLTRSSPEAIISSIGSTWPNGDEKDFGTRAAIIGAVGKAIDSIKLPESLKIPFLRNNSKDFVNDKKFINRIIESSKNQHGTKINEELVPRFAQLAAIYQSIVSNPQSIDMGKISKGVEGLSESISDQFQELSHLNTIMSVWHEALASLKHEPQKEAELGKSSSNYDDIISSIGSFFHQGKKFIDINPYIEEMQKYALEKYGVSEDENLIPVDYDHDVNPESKPITLEDDDSGDINPDSKPVTFNEEEVPEIEASPVLDDKELEKVVQHYVDLLMESVDKKDTAQINKLLKELHHEVFPNLEEDISKVASRIIATSNERNLVGYMSVKNAAYHGVKDQSGNPVDPINTGYKSYDKRYFGKDHFDSILSVAQDFLKSDWLTVGWDNGAPDAPFRAALDLSIHTADNCLYQSKIDTETYNLLLNKLAKWGWDTFSETLLSFKKTASVRGASMKPAHQAILKIANDIRTEHPQDALSILKVWKVLSMSEEASMPEGLKGNPFEISFKSMTDEDFEELHNEVEKSLKDKLSEDDIQAFLDGFDDLFNNIQNKVASFVSPGLVKLASPSVPFSKLSMVVSLSTSDVADIVSIGKKHLPRISSATNPNSLVITVGECLREIQNRVSSNIFAGVPLSELVKLASSNVSLRSSLLPLIAKHVDIAARVKKSKKAIKNKKNGDDPKGKKDKKDTKGKPEKASKSKAKKVAFDKSDLDW